MTAKSTRVETRHCAHCGAEFKPYRPWARFCSPQHRKDHWNETHPRVERRPRPRAQPVVRAMTAALLSLRREP